MKDDKREIMFSETFEDYYEGISNQITKERMLESVARARENQSRFASFLEAWVEAAKPGDVWINPVEERTPTKVFCHFKYVKE